MTLAVHKESNNILSFRSYFQLKGGIFVETPGTLSETIHTVEKSASGRASSRAQLVLPKAVPVMRRIPFVFSFVDCSVCFAFQMT